MSITVEDIERLRKELELWTPAKSYKFFSDYEPIFEKLGYRLYIQPILSASAYQHICAQQMKANATAQSLIDLFTTQDNVDERWDWRVITDNAFEFAKVERHLVLYIF